MNNTMLAMTNPNEKLGITHTNDSNPEIIQENCLYIANSAVPFRELK